MLLKLASLGTSVLLSLGLAGFLAPQPPPDGPPPPKKAREKGAPKKKGEREPGGELKKAYDLLRRLRAEDGAAGRPEEGLRDWTDRAARLVSRRARRPSTTPRRPRLEYGAAAHDLARAVDHSLNAARFDRPDPDLPPPSDDFGLEDVRDRARRDLNRGTSGSIGSAPGRRVRGLITTSRRHVTFIAPRAAASLRRGPRARR